MFKIDLEARFEINDGEIMTPPTPWHQSVTGLPDLVNGTTVAPARGDSLGAGEAR